MIMPMATGTPMIMPMATGTPMITAMSTGTPMIMAMAMVPDCGRRDRASGISRRRDRAANDRPKRGGRGKLLRDSREDLLTLPYIVGREWLFLHGLPRPRAGNGGIGSSNAERFGSFDETAAETARGRSFLESALRGRNNRGTRR